MQPQLYRSIVFIPNPINVDVWPCAAEDCCVLLKKKKQDVDNSAAKSSSLAEIQKLRVKVEKALG